MNTEMKMGRMGPRSGKRHMAKMMNGGLGGPSTGPNTGRHGGRSGDGRGRGERASGDFGEQFGERGGRGFGGGFGGGRGGGRGRGGRMFASGELRLLLLKLVADESRHGYELIKAIDELTGGNYAPSPGVVYPTLSLLVDEAMLIQQGEEAGRKSFAVTDAGSAELTEKAEAAEALITRLRGLADAGEREGIAPVRRAVGNLMAALRGRMAGANLETETIHAIVDLLDDAAKRIERL